MIQSQFTPPTAEDVRELVAKLRRLAPQNLLGSADPTITRAADLLEQLYPASWPGSDTPPPEDCDGEGRCWWFNPGKPAMSNPHIATSSWRLCKMLNGKPMGTHWRPFHALPLPAEKIVNGEQQKEASFQ